MQRQKRRTFSSNQRAAYQHVIGQHFLCCAPRTLARLHARRNSVPQPKPSGCRLSAIPALDRSLPSACRTRHRLRGEMLASIHGAVWHCPRMPPRKPRAHTTQHLTPHLFVMSQVRGPTAHSLSVRPLRAASAGGRRPDRPSCLPRAGRASSAPRSCSRACGDPRLLIRRSVPRTSRSRREWACLRLLCC